jgi:anti-anti-sigma factor
MASDEGTGHTQTLVVIEADGVTSVRLAGDIDVTNAEHIEEVLRHEIEEQRNSLEIDLTGVTYIDTAGIRLLLLAHRLQGAAGGAFRVVIDDAEGFVWRALEVSRLIEVLGIVKPPDLLLKVFESGKNGACDDPIPVYLLMKVFEPGKADGS